MMSRGLAGILQVPGCVLRAHHVPLLTPSCHTSELHRNFFSVEPFVPEDCTASVVSTPHSFVPLWQMSIYGRFTCPSDTHLPSLKHQLSPLHSFFTCRHSGAKSFIKCSGCYDNYECSTCRYNKSLKKLSHRCTAPQL